MVRKWVLAALGAAAVLVILAGYHLFVLHHAAEHWRLLLDCPTVQEKRVHYEEIFRYPHPWNPYAAKARRWLREDGHEWGYLELPVPEGARGAPGDGIR